jgi:hypothetical protein
LPHNNLDFISVGSADGSNKDTRNNGFVLPHAVMKPGLLDVVVFDDRGIHSGTIGVPNHIRVMSATVLCINPFDESMDLKGMGIMQSRDELAKDILAHIRCRRFQKGRSPEQRHSARIFSKLCKNTSQLIS